MTNYEFRHFINGVEFQPIDAQNIGIKIDFMADISEFELNVDTLKLATSAYQEVMHHVSLGVGIFEGIPYEIKVGSVTLEYFVNLTDGVRFTDSYVECKIEKRWSINSFQNNAQGLSFELLNSRTPITGGFDIPYVIIPDNQVELLLLVALAGFQTTMALIQSIRDLVTIITSGTIEAVTPNAGVPPSVSTGSIITIVLKIAAQAIYTTALVLMLIKLTKDTIELIMPKIRKLKGNKVKSLIEQGCVNLGYSFQSSLLDAIPQLTILPVTLVNSKPSILNIILGNSTTYYNKPYPSTNDSIPMLWDLIEEIRNLFNAKIRVINNVVMLERRDYWASYSSSTIKNTLNIQDSRENAHTFNFQNSWKRYFMRYQFDSSDIWTMDNISGHSAEYSTEPLTVTNQDLVTIKTLATISSSFSLTKRKDSLNKVETALGELAQSVDNVVNGLGGNSNLYGIILNRIGVSQFSQQFIGQTRLMYTVGGKQPSNYVDKIGMTAIYDGYHVINQVKENFKAIAESQVPFAPQQFENIIGNNFMYDQNGNQLEIRTFTWVSGSAKADIEYQYPSDLAWNTQTIKIA
jgi:hypothetical protein